MAFRKLVNIITWPMNLIGVNPLIRDNVYNSHIRIFFCCIFHIYGIYGTIQFSIHANGDFYNTVIPIAYCVCLMMVLLAVLNLHANKRRLRYLLLNFNDQVFNYPDEEYFSLKYEGFLSEDSFLKLHMLIMVFEITGFVFSGSSPFIGYVLVGKLRTFIYPGWVPYEVNSKRSYIITYILQVPVASSVFWVYYVLQVYLTFVLVEFLRQFRRLQVALETLHERTCWEINNQLKIISNPEVHSERRKVEIVNRINYQSFNVNREHKSCYDKVFKNNLILCVKHHQKLHRLYGQFKVPYENFFSTELMTVGASFSLLLYCLVEKNDPESYTTLIGVTWLLLSNLFSRCFIGEQFSAMNYRIQNALFYDTNWYEHNVENRKLIYTFHLFSQRSFTLKGLSTFESSFFTFSNIVKKSYSYFNLIRAS